MTYAAPDLQLDDYADNDLDWVLPAFLLHDAARAIGGVVAHAVPLGDGSDSLVVAIHFQDKQRAQMVFDFLHAATDGGVMSWQAQQDRRALVEDLVQTGGHRASA